MATGFGLVRKYERRNGKSIMVAIVGMAHVTSAGELIINLDVGETMTEDCYYAIGLDRRPNGRHDFIDAIHMATGSDADDVPF